MGAYEIWLAPIGLRRDEGRPGVAHGARTGEARARVEQTHCVLQPRHSADERTLSQRHARKFIRHREEQFAGGTVGILAAHRVRRLVPVRAKHAQPRRGRCDRLGHRRSEGSAECSLKGHIDSASEWPPVLAGGGHLRVAGVFEEEDGARRGGEGRGGDGSMKGLL